MPDLPRGAWIARFIAELEILHSHTGARPMTTHYLRSIAAQQWDLRGKELEPDDAALLWHTQRTEGVNEWETPMGVKDAWNRGYMAAENGASLADNPCFGEDERAAWEDGFRAWRGPTLDPKEIAPPA